MTTTEEIQGWSVTVEINAETVLTIGHNSVSGLSEFTEEQAEVIRGCAGHLRAFIGEASGSTAALAQAQVEAVPVGEIVADDPVHGWHMKALVPWEQIGAGAKLYAAANAAIAAPPGWRLVPVEPTKQMIDAYLTAQRAAVMATDQAWGVSSPSANFKAGYAALIAATPLPGEQE